LKIKPPSIAYFAKTLEPTTTLALYVVVNSEVVGLAPGTYKASCFEKSPAGLPDGLFSYQKIPIWIYFGGPWNGKCWYI
jgi:hypothetical protein